MVAGESGGRRNRLDVSERERVQDERIKKQKKRQTSVGRLDELKCLSDDVAVVL